MPSVGINYRMDRDAFVVRWKSGGSQEVPVQLAGGPHQVPIAGGRDAAYRIAERVKARVEASDDATDKPAFLLFRDHCIAEENQAFAEIAPIATAVLPPPDVCAQEEPPAHVAPTQCGPPPTSLLARSAHSSDSLDNCVEQHTTVEGLPDNGGARHEEKLVVRSQPYAYASDPSRDGWCTYLQRATAASIADVSNNGHQLDAAMFDNGDEHDGCNATASGGSSRDHLAAELQTRRTPNAVGVANGTVDDMAKAMRAASRDSSRDMQPLDPRLETFVSENQPLEHNVFAKSIRRPWANDVANGDKFFECVANEKRWENKLQRLGTGSLLIIVEAESASVMAVGEVAHPAVTRMQNRAALYSMVLPERRPDLDAYLGAAKDFDYVLFSRVYDLRDMRAKESDFLARFWPMGMIRYKFAWDNGMAEVHQDRAVWRALRVLIQGYPSHDCTDGMDVF